MVATGLVLSSVTSRSVVRNMAKLQKEAYFVSSTVYQQLTQIGFRSIDPANLDGRLVPVASTEQAFPAIDGEWQAGQLMRATEYSFSYRFQGASTIDDEADETIFDCLGNSLDNSTYEAKLSLTNNRLECSVGTEMAVLVGEDEGIIVEEVVFTLGVDSDNDDGIDTQVSAKLATLDEVQNTRQVTMRMLLATRDHVVKSPQTYHFNGNEFVANDKKLRTETVISVAIRN